MRDERGCSVNRRAFSPDQKGENVEQTSLPAATKVRRDVDQATDVGPGLATGRGLCVGAGAPSEEKYEVQMNERAGFHSQQIVQTILHGGANLSVCGTTYQHRCRMHTQRTGGMPMFRKTILALAATATIGAAALAPTSASAWYGRGYYGGYHHHYYGGYGRGYGYRSYGYGRGYGYRSYGRGYGYGRRW
jgi:hypothetical protein